MYLKTVSEESQFCEKTVKPTVKRDTHIDEINFSLCEIFKDKVKKEKKNPEGIYIFKCLNYV